METFLTQLPLPGIGTAMGRTADPTLVPAELLKLPSPNCDTRTARNPLHEPAQRKALLTSEVMLPTARCPCCCRACGPLLASGFIQLPVSLPRISRGM